MSHQVQNAIFSMVEGIGWHGIGQAIPADIANDPQKMAELLNATWSVIQRPAFYQNASGQFVPVADYAAQVRSDTGTALSMTSSNRYHTDNRQPVDIIEAFRDELLAENLHISHAAVLRGGKIVVVSAKLEMKKLAVSGTDTLMPYVTLVTGYDGQTGTKLMLSTIRTVCNNTLQMSLSEAQKTGKFKTIRASSRINDIQTLRDLVANVDGIVTENLRTYDALSNSKISDAEVAKYFADVLQIDISQLGKVDKDGKNVISTKSQNMLDALVNAYRNAPGAMQASGTLWGAVNAVTYYATHEKTVRDTCDDGALNARVASNLIGDSAKLKNRALELASLKVAA